MSLNTELLEKLEENDREPLMTSLTICLKLLDNIINNPKEEKYKKFKKSNKKISSELLSVNGMESIFLEVGFELDNDEYVLRRGGIGVINKLKLYRDFLQKRLEAIKSNDPAKIKKEIKVVGTIPKSVPQSPVKREIAIKITADKSFKQRIDFPKILKTNNVFLRELEFFSDSTMQYEDESLKKSTLQLIPLEKFKLNAIENLRKLQKMIKEKEINEDEPVLDDLVLEELAAWFKNEFFKWVNNMDCKACKQDTKPCGTRNENNMRVEQFFCDRCKIVTEFPRYNDIEKLLVTRSGRCGEFANCFTFLCRCLGYDARYIYSTSDHVWTEVYNHSKKRWIHIDPSENVFDSPLMYEHGWKKKLDYVFAFSKDDCQDVTWRYSNQHEELRKRRKRCTEDELISAIIMLRKKRQLNVSEARKKFLNLRSISELAELLIERKPTEDELKGRSSGSLAWRLQRGETNLSNNYTFKLTPKEIESKQFNLRYSCAKNRYERFVGSLVLETGNDWSEWHYESQNMFRKVEHDHKMVYLSRTENSTSGIIQWNFNFDNQVVKSFQLKCDTKTFESGRIKVEFFNASGQIVENFIGESKFSIRVHLSGGNGDCAWQHAQLFRQSSNSEEFPLQLEIKFN
jgi:peptide-N4-(N-acetyl-beta-glucosaminyl)asparagine amidase